MSEAREALAVTKRLVLRDYWQSDWRAIHSLRSEPAATRFLDSRRPPTQLGIWFFVGAVVLLSRARPRPYLQLAVVLRGSGELIGECSVMPHPSGREALLGYLLHPAHWGRGYATEAARGALDLAFAELRYDCVRAGCHPENVASRRVLEKLGMEFQGEEARFPGSPRGESSLVFSITREEWQGRLSAPASADV